MRAIGIHVWPTPHPSHTESVYRHLPRILRSHNYHRCKFMFPQIPPDAKDFCAPAYPPNHSRLRINPGHWLVWRGVLSHIMRVHATLRSSIPIFQRQVDISDEHGRFCTWQSGLCCEPYKCWVDRWQSYRGIRKCWSCYWRNGYIDSHRCAGKEGNVQLFCPHDVSLHLSTLLNV